MEEDLKILEEIGNVKCKKCDGICLLDKYTHNFVCQQCGTRYILKVKE